jgi:ComF family protein
LRGWAGLVVEMLLTALYPPGANCMGCKSPAGADMWLCDDCRKKLIRISDMGGVRCARCGRPRPSARCETCGGWPQALIPCARFCYPYRAPANGMIRRLKYQGVTRMAGWMAQEMCDTVRRELPGGYDALVPVPMHSRRLRLRGVNHARVLALGMSSRLDLPCLDALCRLRDTPQQARLSAAQRRRNLAGAFSASHSACGKKILLVDDVVTSGATALECARALLSAGAKSVHFIAFAGAIDPHTPRKN